MIHNPKPGSVHRYTSTLEAHGVLVLKLSGATSASPPSFTFYNAAASGNTLAGGASIRVVSSSISVVGFVGNGGTLTFNGVDGGSSGGTKLVSFDYINADFVFSNTACSNCRNAFISVNGGTPVQVQMPISGQVRSICRLGKLEMEHSSLSSRAGTSSFLDTSYPFLGSQLGKLTPFRSRIQMHGHLIFIVLGSRPNIETRSLTSTTSHVSTTVLCILSTIFAGSSRHF